MDVDWTSKRVGGGTSPGPELVLLGFGFDCWNMRTPSCGVSSSQLLEGGGLAFRGGFEPDGAHVLGYVYGSVLVRIGHPWSACGKIESVQRVGL